MEIEYLISFCIIIIFIWFKFKTKKYNFQREYKKCESHIEKKLIEEMFKEGLLPYSQINCGRYRIDIAIIKKGKKIAIECDGYKYHSTYEQKLHDEKKNVFLESKGWKVLRFTGKEIYHDADWCVKVIKSRI